MTILEKKSERKKKAIINLVKSGEYSVGYALILAEELSDNGKLTNADYEELAEYLENLLDKEVQAPEEIYEETSTIEEIPEENAEISEEETAKNE